MLKRLLLTNKGVVARCYSTISTRSTISHVPKSEPIQRTPKSKTINTTKSSPLPPSSIKEQIVNLQKIPQNFDNQLFVIDKSELLIQKLRHPETPIRIGLLGSKRSFLNTILADPFASDQSWYDALLNRPDGSLIKYSADYENFADCFMIPSPILETHNIEFFEIKELNYSDDKCHLYINFGEPIDPKYPTYEFKDNENVEIPETNEINSKLAYEAVNLLKESPLNSTTYTKLYNTSNFPSFHDSLAKLVEPDFVISKLYSSIVKTLETQNVANSLTLKDIDAKDQAIRKFISQWDENAHFEFQKHFVPYINRFENEQLSWWKLYYKNDDIEAILTNMLNTGFLNDSLKNYSYVRGQIDSFTSYESRKVGSVPPELAQNPLTSLKNEVIENDLYPIQNSAIKTLLMNFLGLQFPVVLVSTGGYALYDFSLYSMFGLGLLGVVLGFSNVSKRWIKEFEQFKTMLFEKTRLAILDTNEHLYSCWETKYESEREQILKRLELIEKLKSAK